MGFLEIFLLFFLFVFTLGGCSATRMPEQTTEPVASPPTTESAGSTPWARLRKLSLHLRGQLPDAEDYEALQLATNAGKSLQFFHQTAQKYLRSPEHIGKMISRLDELFRLKTAAGLPETRLRFPEGNPLLMAGQETLNAMDLLFQEVAEKNLPWDYLATAKTYTLTNPSLYSGGRTSDFEFLKMATTLPPEQAFGGKPQFFPVSFLANDPRFAGAVTTARFFGRYSTTNLNKNRGRAAAIFRIFLCDDMKAVVTPSAEEEQELLENAFPIPAPDFHAKFSQFTDDDDKKHGSNPACMNCHYKLDPLGKAFIHIGNAMPPYAAPGKLVYRRADNSLVDHESDGLAGILQFLTTQPEYAACQVTHFWKWFIRGDELPSPSRLKELVQAFERRNRRTNDFIAYLVEQPEFTLDPKALNPAVTTLQVGPILQHCDACHGGNTESPIPLFTKLPLGGDATAHEAWLTKIVEQLDLVHDGKDRTMPPVESVWQPSPEELALLKRWIAEGVKGDQGVPTISSAFAQALLQGSPAPAPLPRMEFRDSYVRYLRTHDLFRVLTQQFPGKAKDSACYELNENNRTLLGDTSPQDGELAFKTPSPAFVRWYGKCLLSLIDSTLALKEGEQKFSEFYGTSPLIPSGAKLDPKNFSWNRLPAESRYQIVLQLISKLTGESRSEPRSLLATELISILDKKGLALSCYEAISKVLFLIGSSDAFLVY